MKTVIFYLLIFHAAHYCYGQKFPFTYHEMGQFGNRMGQTSLVDLDKDGDLDFVFGRLGNLYAYEYIASSKWIHHDLGEGAVTDVGGCPLDVNGDGWIDYVVGDSWYEHPGNQWQGPFILHRKNMISSHDNIVVDIDQDGNKDVVSVSNDRDHPVLAWYRIGEDFSGNWDYHKVARGIHGGISPRGWGDMDNDRDIDIVCGDAWYENTDGRGLKWDMHHILLPDGGSRPDEFGLALKSWCIDLNHDGHLDIVQAEADSKNGRIFWWKNAGDAQAFDFYLISRDSTNQDFHSLVLADFDNDGDQDIASGGGPLSVDPYKLFIWENLTGDGMSWKEHLILEGKESHEMVAGDVDVDGDIDICTKPWRGNVHFYLENRTIR